MTTQELLQSVEETLKNGHRLSLQNSILSLKQMMAEETEGERAMDLANAIFNLELILKEQL